MGIMCLDVVSDVDDVSLSPVGLHECAVDLFDGDGACFFFEWLG